MERILSSVLPEIVLQPDATLPEAALAYARAGLPVLPLHGKVPLVSHGLDDATINPAVIEHWWQRWPKANIGIPTGLASGWLVLDVDPRHGGLESFEHLQHALRHRATDLGCSPVFLLATRLQRTGGSGLHLLFGWRDDLNLGNTTGFAGYHGLDMRGKRGYIVVAPSSHPSGSVYTWLNSGQIQPFPDLLVDLLDTRKRALAVRRFPLIVQSTPRLFSTHRKDPASVLDSVLAQVYIGNRHQKAITLAFQLLQKAELSPTQAKRWMREYVRHVPQGEGEERYPVEDALKCLKWVVEHIR